MRHVPNAQLLRMAAREGFRIDYPKPTKHERYSRPIDKFNKFAPCATAEEVAQGY